jgi:hypothetical protein
MTFHTTRDVRIIMPKTALLEIFDECDRFDHDETGGRILGTFRQEGNQLVLHVSGLIDSGPQARRSAVSFFQDGDYQERVFRQIESKHPEIEHLGNWHTHHMNGLQHLSPGDLATYHRIVNHENHNTPFFYALLIVAKQRRGNPLGRYSTKHYIFRKDDAKAYEIPERMIELVDSKLLSNPSRATHSMAPMPAMTHSPMSKSELLSDNDFAKDFYPEIRPFKSPKLGLYWRGPIGLVNGESVQVVVVENQSAHQQTYSLALRDTPENLQQAAEELMAVDYPTARAALIQAERTCNRALFSQRSDIKKTR